MWAGLLAAALCYLLAAGGRRGESPSLQVFRLAVAGTFVWLAAGAAAGALTSGYHAVFGAGASHAYCATLRTGVLAGLALVLAWTGAHWNRAELSRLIYPAMILGAYRLPWWTWARTVSRRCFSRSWSTAPRSWPYPVSLARAPYRPPVSGSLLSTVQL